MKKMQDNKWIMTGNVGSKQSAKKVDGDDGLKTLECLRGRLLSERGVSKAANQESAKLGNKLIELENKLKQEVKWRNRAEKRLKSLIKKLESMKIEYVVSDELSTSLSSSSSTPSYPNKHNDKKNPNSQIKTISDDDLQCTRFSERDDHRSKPSNYQDWDETSVDNSMALVPVDIPATTQTTIEPLITNNAGVKDVLDTLRYVKERLQSSRHMIRAGI